MKNNPSILVVDDEIIIAEDILNRLQTLGYNAASTARTYAVGLERAAKAKPHIAIIDIGLQGTEDGIDLGEELQKKYGCAVIYMTGYTKHPGILEKLEGAVYDGLLHKPFLDDHFAEIIQRVADEQQLRRV